MSYTTSASPCGGKGKDTFANKKKWLKDAKARLFSVLLSQRGSKRCVPRACASGKRVSKSTAGCRNDSQSTKVRKKRPLRVKICKNKNPVLIFLLIFAPRFSCYRKAPSRCLAWRSWETRIAFVGNAQGVRGKRTTGASGTTSPERLQLKARSAKSGTQPPGADGCNFRT